jgi:hypothetical protein
MMKPRPHPPCADGEDDGGLEEHSFVLRPHPACLDGEPRRPALNLVVPPDKLDGARMHDGSKLARHRALPPHKAEGAAATHNGLIPTLSAAQVASISMTFLAPLSASFARRHSDRYTMSMTPTPIDQVAFERATDPILQFFTPEQARALADYRGDAGLADEIELLAQKCNEGELTEAERARYEGYVRANKFIAILQAKARKLLAS